MIRLAAIRQPQSLPIFGWGRGLIRSAVSLTEGQSLPLSLIAHVTG